MSDFDKHQHSNNPDNDCTEEEIAEEQIFKVLELYFPDDEYRPDPKYLNKPEIQSGEDFEGEEEHNTSKKHNKSNNSANISAAIDENLNNMKEIANAIAVLPQQNNSSGQMVEQSPDHIEEDANESIPELKFPRISFDKAINIADFIEYEHDIVRFSESEKITIMFWVYFHDINLHEVRNQIVLLGFGNKPKKPMIQFSIKEVEGFDKQNKKRSYKAMVVNFIQENNKLGTIVSECAIDTDQKYMISFEINRSKDCTILVLYVNDTLQGEVAFKEQILVGLLRAEVGPTVSSSPFHGVISDVAFYNYNIDRTQVFEQNLGLQDGRRCVAMVQEKLISELVERDHNKTGHPRPYLWNYKYKPNFDQKIPPELIESPRSDLTQGTPRETMQDQTSSQLLDERIRENVNHFIKEQMETDPDFFMKLEVLYSSRKWLFRAFNLYSPEIDGSGESKLDFKSLHKSLTNENINNHEYPFYPITFGHFFKIVNQAVEISMDEARKMEELVERSNALYHSKEGAYLLYDIFLHYLCNAEGLKPPEEPKTEEGSAEERQEGGEEEFDPNQNEDGREEEPQEEDIKNEEALNAEYELNFFFGHKNPAHLQDELSKFRKKYGYRMEHMRLYAFIFNHLDEFTNRRFESVKFCYLLKVKKEKTWDEIYEYMHTLNKNILGETEGNEFFQIEEWETPLIPQKLTESGEFDTDDQLYLFKDTEKRKQSIVYVDQLLDFKFRLKNGIVYSIRADTTTDEGEKRPRIEFREPNDIPYKEGEDDPNSKTSVHYIGGVDLVKYGIAIVNRDRQLVGFGLYSDIENAIEELAPELNIEAPIEKFTDVLNTHKIETTPEEKDKVNTAIFKWNKSRIVSISIKGERKANNDSKWPSTIKAEGKELTEEEQAKAEFNINFLHPITLNRLEEEERTKLEEAEKEKKKNDKKKKPAKGKSKKEDIKKKEVPIDPAEAIEYELELNVNQLAKVRVDYSYGVITKLLFTYKDESAKVIEVPAPEPPKEIAPEAAEAAQKQGQGGSNLGSQVDEPKEVKREDVLNQALYSETHIVKEEGVLGLYCRFKKELSDITFWGTELEEKEEDNKDNQDDEMKQTDEGQDNQEDQEEEQPRLTDKDDFMEGKLTSEQIKIDIAFCISFYTKSERVRKPRIIVKPDRTTEEENPAIHDTVHPKRFNHEEYSENFERVCSHIKRIIPTAVIYGNYDPPSCIGEFTVYSYGLGDLGKTIYFSNVLRKARYPKLSDLYYFIVDILIKYEDISLIEEKQKEYLRSKKMEINPRSPHQFRAKKGCDSQWINKFSLIYKLRFSDLEKLILLILLIQLQMSILQFYQHLAGNLVEGYQNTKNGVQRMLII